MEHTRPRPGGSLSAEELFLLALVSVSLYLPSPQRETFGAGGEGGKEGAEKKKEMGGENEVEPVSLGPGLGVGGACLPLAVTEGEGIKK